MKNDRHEELCFSLNDQDTYQAYYSSLELKKAAWGPRLMATLLITAGNFLYGKNPSYGKFKALEVIARIPYQSWEVAIYMLLTLGYADEKRAIKLSETSRFSRTAQDNETMHVVALSQLAKIHQEDSLIRHTFIPLVFSFGYFVADFLLYLFKPRFAFQLNALFESHALSQYQAFLEREGERLRHTPLQLDFLHFYGRYVKTEYEFFLSVRNDELIHRNQSLRSALEGETLA